MKLLYKISIFFAFMFPADNRLKIIQADIMQSFEEDSNPITELSGNVILQKNTLSLYTNKATNYPNLNIFKLTGPVTMIDNFDTVKCNNMTYFSASLDFILATGDVNFKKSNQLIQCDSLYYWTDIDSGYAIGNVKFNQEKREIITDYIHYKETDGPKGLSFSAYQNVSIVENNRLIKADTLTYNDYIEIMSLKNGGTIKEAEKGLSGDEILIQYRDTLLVKVDISSNAKAWQDINKQISNKNSNYYQFRNEMKSKFISVNFEKNEIKKMSLYNMAETIYHVSEDSLLVGTNHASGDTIIISFENSELMQIQVIGGGKGVFSPEFENTKIDTNITYKANYLNYYVDKEQTELIQNSVVEYQDIKLNAGNILVSWRENILNAMKYNDVLPTIYSGDAEPLTGNNMTFDLVTKHGKINKGITEYNNGYYHGNKIFRDEPDIFHVKESKYTSCEHENPHYYFASNKMKLIGNDRVIAKPLVLHIYDIPIIGIPFAVFPNKGGRRHSGWIMPAFGTRTSTGTFFQKLGYYYAPNDFIDLKTLIDFYDKLGLVINSRFNYIKRYKYSGSISTRMNQSLVGKNILDLFKNYSRQFNLVWNHSQKFDPSQNLSINGHYISNSDFYQSQWNDKQNQLTQKIESSFNYSKRWSTYKNSLTINLSDSYDLLAIIKKEENIYGDKHFLVERMQALPNMSFSHSKSKLKFGNYKIPFLEDIYWDYSSNLNNNIRKGWKFELADSNWVDSTNVRSGIRHNMSFSTSNKFFGWISLSPRISFRENWVNQYTKLNENYQLEYVNNFKRRLTWNSTFSLTTKLYGLFPISIGKLDALRHVLTPSLSFSWSPKFTEDNSPYIQALPDTNLIHDYFYGTLAGATPSSETKSIGFNVSNVFQAKINKEDNYSKIDLLSWSLNSNYNFKADSLKFSPINSNISSTLPNGLRLSLSMSHDLYDINTSGHRINKFRKFPRLKSINGGTTLKFSGKQFKLTSPNIDTTEVIIQNSESKTTSDVWNSTFSLRYSFTPRIQQEPLINFWVNSNIDIKLTPAWKMNYNVRLDLENLELVTHDFTFRRNLHCFEFLFEWTPSGYRRGFYLRINVINRDLKESIKLESRGGKSFWQ
tara:strand:+ start:3243 stop:6566 length:3324 start_codon:yes stop_codon:yes gene_type:complete